MSEILFKNYDSITMAELEANLLKASGIRCRVQKGELHQNLGSIAGASIFILEKDISKAEEILSND